jgi:SP family galactose:H+ symporter-like MFS transporter
MNTQGKTESSALTGQTTSTVFVFIAAVLAAVGGLLFGYDTGVISGALLFIKTQFHLSVFHQELVVSVVLIGATVGALSGGKLADAFGRRLMLLVTAVIFVAGAIVCAAAGSVGILIVGRIVVGLGIGLASTTVPVYISEVSPAGARGWQVSLFQLAVTVGILGAYLVDYGFGKSGSWRWMLGLAVVPGAMLGLGMLAMPETPRWLAKHGRGNAAQKVLARIRGTQNVQAEYAEIQDTISRAKERGHFSDLLSPLVRPALTVGIGLAIFQQITGINTVIYYAPTIIQSAGIPSATGAILATAGIGVVNVLMTLVAMWLIDRVGRRPLLLTGISGMVVSLGILGLVFRTHAPSSEQGWLAVFILMAYVASFAISLGPIFWLLIAEIYPLKIRGIAEGTAAGTNWAANLLASLTFLSLVQALGPSWTFWLYGLLTIGSPLFSYFMVPETKGRTLEEIEQTLRSKRGLSLQRQ